MEACQDYSLIQIDRQAVGALLCPWKVPPCVLSFPQYPAYIQPNLPRCVSCYSLHSQLRITPPLGDINCDPSPAGSGSGSNHSLPVGQKRLSHFGGGKHYHPSGFQREVASLNFFRRKGFPSFVRYFEWIIQVFKLDGVGPVNNRPSTNQLHHFSFFLFNFFTLDT